MRFSVTMVALLGFFAHSVSAIKVDVTYKPDPCEKVVESKEHVSLHYKGSIDESSSTGEKGKVFDSSIERNEPFGFQIGVGQVIKGFDEGIVGLCVGSKATLIVPPEEGYGEQGAGADIPGGATLRFDIEIVSSSKDAPAGGRKQPNVFAMIDENKDRKISKEEALAFFKKQGMDSVPEQLWETEDKDKDGFISFEEFSGPKGEDGGDAQEDGESDEL